MTTIATQDKMNTPVILDKEGRKLTFANAREAGAHLGLAPSAVVVVIETARLYEGWKITFEKNA